MSVFFPKEVCLDFPVLSICSGKLLALLDEVLVLPVSVLELIYRVGGVLKVKKTRNKHGQFQRTHVCQMKCLNGKNKKEMHLRMLLTQL